MKCQKCGKENDDTEAKFCKYCGAELPEPSFVDGIWMLVKGLVGLFIISKILSLFF